MASTAKPIPSLVGYGMTQANARHLVPDGYLWDLDGFRPNKGRLEEVPRIIRTQEKEENKFIDSLPRPSSSVSGRFIVYHNGDYKYLNISATPLANFCSDVETSSRYKVFTRTYSGTTYDEEDEVILHPGNGDDFSYSVPASTYRQLEVNTTSTTQFKWRWTGKNPTVWSPSITIVPEYSIGTNGVKIYFPKTTVKNNQTWYLTYAAGATLGAGYMAAQVPAVYGNEMFVVSDGYVYRIVNGLMIPAGAWGMTGRHCVVFNQHLIVSQPEWNSADPLSAQGVHTVAWSHLAQPDEFVSTVYNEADQYTIPEQAITNYSHLGITGMAIWNDILYITLAGATYVCQYVGLPRVMKFDQLSGTVGNLFMWGLVRATTGLYFIGESGIFRITSGRPENVGEAAFAKFSSEIVSSEDQRHQWTFGLYNQFTEEVCWIYWRHVDGKYLTRMMVFQEKTGHWYFRSLPSYDSSGGQCCDIRCACPEYGSSGRLTFAGQMRNTTEANYVLREAAPNESLALAMSETYDAGSKFAQPYFETGWKFHGDMYSQKEIDSIYIDAYWASPSALLMYVDTRESFLGDGIPKYKPLPTVTLRESQQLSSFPRKPFRYITYRFQLTNTNEAATLTSGAVFNGYQENLRFFGSQQ